MWTKIKLKIKFWWNKLRGKEEQFSISTAPSLYHTSQPLYQIRADTKLDSLVFTGNSGEDIFRIDPDGNAYWLKEDSYDEAAEMLLIAANWHVENFAGIQQSRVDWEKSITEALVRAAEERGGSLTAEELTDVVRKCIMYDKLRGKYGEN